MSTSIRSASVIKSAGLAGLFLFALAATGTAQRGTKTAVSTTAAEQRPPKGMCRIWLKDVPAAQQPAPTDCAAAVKNCPPNGRVLFGETDRSRTKPGRDTMAAVEDKKPSPLIKSLVDPKKSRPPATTAVPRKPPA